MNALVDANPAGKVEPREYCERVADDDSFTLPELGELRADELEPALKAGVVRVGELRVEHDLTPPAQLLREPVLPVLAGPAVLDPVQDQEAPLAFAH